MTFDRARALVREDIEFLTWDHPLTSSAIDALIGSDAGNAVFGVLPDDNGAILLLECFFVLECVAPTANQLRQQDNHQKPDETNNKPSLDHPYGV